MTDIAVRRGRKRRVLALLVACSGPPCALAAPQAACPDLSGRYRVAASRTPAQADLLRALQITAQAGEDDLKLESAAGGVLTLQLLPARAVGAAPDVRTLFRGSDFECRDGRVVLKTPVASARQAGSAHLEGGSTVRLARSADGSLAIEVSFSGSERADLYRYDSARISVPRPFSGRMQVERFSWPPADRLPPPAQPEAPSPAALREDETRVRMTGLLGSGRVGFVKTVAGGVRVQLRATRGEDLVAAEDRLRAAGLPFEIEREPVWSGNTYLAEIRLPDAPGAGAGPGRPSAFRVAAELNRLLPAGAHAEKVRRLGESYVADVLLLQGDGAGLAESVPRRSTMVARVVLLPPDAQRPPSAGRVERWLMTLKP